MSEFVCMKAGRQLQACRLLLLSIVAMSAMQPRASAQFPTNNDPTNQIRFDTPAEADAKRTSLINFIWNTGLPSTLPSVSGNVAFPNQSVGIDPLNVARVDRLTSNVSGWGFQSVAYLMHPANPTNANRVVIVSQGHADDLMSGVGATANHLLQNGFTVLVEKMPLYGWNTDTTATIPGQGNVTFGSHDQIITNTSPTNGGRGFRMFLEPIVQGINHVVATMPGLVDVSMTGLSGGGWATSLMAAVDTRIKTSVPVAGSAPLYVRNQDGSSNDLEQYYAPLYGENIQPDGSGGGVATWLEIYALGGYGNGRKQIAVTNQFDTCCFSGTFPTTYRTIVADKVAALGAGQWQHVLDSSHHTHQISSNVLSTVINPALGITNPALSPRQLPQIDNFDDQATGIPAGWSIDPASAGGTVATENGGKVTIQGTGLASIAHNAPINVQTGSPVTISIDIVSMSADNFAGVFFTDNIGSRAFHLGPIFNASNNQFGLNADNGEGFNASLDRAMLTTISGYSGGKANMSLTFDTTGFTLEFDPEIGTKYSSGKQPWSRVPGGFNLAKLGDYSQLFIQSFDINGGAPASLILDSISVTGQNIPGDYNGDNSVDAADYVVWRKSDGSQAGYQLWRANFGIQGLDASRSGSSVPEPTVVISILIAIVACNLHDGRRFNILSSRGRLHSVRGTLTRCGSCRPFIH